MPRREPDEGTSLLIRNLARHSRAEDIRYAAERYGRVRDVYLPKDYHTGEPRGLGFIEFEDPNDAEDARDALDRALFDGREIQVVFAQQGRKRPDDYRRGTGAGSRGYGGGGSGRRSSRSPRRHSYSRHRSPRRSHRHSYSRSPSRSRSRTPRRRCSPSRSATPNAPTSPPQRKSSPLNVSRSPVKESACTPSSNRNL